MPTIPKRADEKTRMRAALLLASKLQKECGVDGDVAAIAADIVQHCRGGDGFRMAKDLENHGWECDLQIVEILDDFEREVRNFHEAYLREFQEEHKIEPEFQPGDHVKTKDSTGVVAEIYKYRPLTYSLKMDNDPASDKPTNRRSLLYFDEVTVIPEPKDD